MRSLCVPAAFDSHSNAVHSVCTVHTRSVVLLAAALSHWEAVQMV
jgi:hypothetical protein